MGGKCEWTKTQTHAVLFSSRGNKPVMCKKPSSEDVEGSQLLNQDPSGDGAWGWEEEAFSPGLKTVSGSRDAYVSEWFIKVYSCVLAGDSVWVSAMCFKGRGGEAGDAYWLWHSAVNIIQHVHRTCRAMVNMSLFCDVVVMATVSFMH